ncbi:hypothetical protein Hanom_Chr15g01345011 [Helianthus anomalus]
MAKDHSNKSSARGSYKKMTKLIFGFCCRLSHNHENNIPNQSLSTSNSSPPFALNQPIVVEVIEAPKTDTFSTPKVKPFKKFVCFSSSVIRRSEDRDRKELTKSKTFSEGKYDSDSHIDHTKFKMGVPLGISDGSTNPRR